MDLSLFEEHTFGSDASLYINKEPLINETLYFEELWNKKPDSPGFITIGNSVYQEHRCNSLYTKDGCGEFKYAGKIVKSEGRISDDEILTRCFDISEKIFPHISFTAAFVNWYSDGNEYVGAHSDDVKLSSNDTIISFTFLEDDDKRRAFTINDFTKNTIIHKFFLRNGDCVIMGEGFQSKFKHAVPKMSIKKTSRRINVTIRALI